MQQRKQRRFQGLPTDFVPAYIEAAPSREQGFAVSYAQSRKETQAAMLFLIHGDTASYHIGWSNDAGRKANAHNLLMWRGIEYLRRIGVTVNALSPSAQTRMTEGLRELTEEQRAMRDPKWVSPTVVYLASEEARYVTGQTLHVNGGMAMV